MTTARLAFALLVACIPIGCGSDSTKTGDDDTFSADPPAVYVAKVKNILVGLPPTDAEVKAVVDDPGALKGLIDGWMGLPEYDAKMRVFFELAFQQTQISPADLVDLIPPRGLGNGRALPLLVQNVRESFARTVIELADQGKALTDAFTTHQLMMTPALMTLYAFMDWRRIDNDGVINDIFARQNPNFTVTLEASKGPIPMAESMDPTSPNYLHFYNPDILTQNYPDAASCEGLDPISAQVNGLELMNMLYGEIPQHQGRTSACPQRGGGINSPQAKGTDFTDWRMVTIRPPVGGEARTDFYNLDKLRGANELVLTTPHPGFFSTPAFMLNWATNDSNKMRVTLNQSLIVATGAQIDGTDTTVPDSTPGLDEEHAPKDSSCYLCHQLLDPTRSILSATYSWFYYPQTDPALKAQPGLFAFQGVVQAMSTIDDFAQILSTHPLVPTAWAQKLCYYANSAPCDSTDPELTRVIDAFSGSGMQWNTLVRELLASPIVTNAAPTVTSNTNGEVVSVARRDHLCAQLDSRLGFVDICELDATLRRRPPSTIALIVGGLPSDGYGRGSTVPVLPNEATLFYRSGLENICAELAVQVVDGNADPAQPGKKMWSSGDPDTAISDFVSTLLAFTPSDPRSTQANLILHSHFTSAQTQGASAQDALRSTFVAACLSPSFIGIGM